VTLPLRAVEGVERPLFAHTAVDPNGSASFPFVIPSAAEGSAVPLTNPGNVFFD
jgi:hypothetical protein